MGKQGKGILGNFSGRVGNIVGAVVKCRGTIRKSPRKRESTQFFKAVYKVATFVNVIDTNSGASFCNSTDVADSLTAKGEINELIKTRNGGIIWKLRDKDRTIIIGISSERLNVPTFQYTTSITLTKFGLSLGINSNFTFIPVRPQLNETFELRWIAGRLFFMRDYGGLKMKKVIDATGTLKAPFLITCNPNQTGSGMVAVQIGKSANT